jgi:catechol 2,3-dioxygenase-like lactoylglutathione lyase family enzyme
MSVKPIPEGYHSITPYLGILKAAEAIEFYKKAFGATQVMRLDMPDGRIGHAELRIGDSAIMLGTPCDQGPLSGRTMPCRSVCICMSPMSTNPFNGHWRPGRSGVRGQGSVLW